MRTIDDVEKVEVWVYTDEEEPHYAVKIDDVKNVVYEEVELIEKEMECLPEIAREQYLFLAGKRHMLIEFFNLDDRCK